PWLAIVHIQIGFLLCSGVLINLPLHDATLPSPPPRRRPCRPSHLAAEGLAGGVDRCPDSARNSPGDDLLSEETKSGTCGARHGGHRPSQRTAKGIGRAAMNQQPPAP